MDNLSSPHARINVACLGYSESGYRRRGTENVEWGKVSEEEAIDLDELKDMFPDDFCGV